MSEIEANPATPAASQASQAAPPEAAIVVEKGKLTEDALALRQENRELRDVLTKQAKRKRDVEIANAYLQDENHRLKQIPSPVPVTTPAAKASYGWFNNS